MRLFWKRPSKSPYAFYVGGIFQSRRARIFTGSVLTGIALFFILPASITGGIYSWIKDDIPSSNAILIQKPSLSTYIYDSEGTLIGSFAAERRRLVSLDDVAEPMRQAIVAVEDSRFYQHWGIDPVGIIRAAFSNLRKGGISQGASTITQQLVRQLVLNNERSFKRKIIEAISAVRLEMSLSKDEILERYLNQVYFGRGAYGVAAAARTYFDKEASELTTAEAALLAGLVQAPGRYRPFEEPGPVEKRRAHVLRRMAAIRYMPREEAERLAKTPLNLRSPEPVRVGGHFVEYIRRQLEEMFGNDRLYRGGLRVYTSLSLKDQVAAEEAVRTGIEKLVKRRWRKSAKKPKWRSPEAALFAMDPRTGAIRAMVGGLNFQKSKFNRAVQAYRQPGSAFKPIVYAAAIESGFTPVDAILDAPLVLNGGAGRPDWKPRNYARDFQGRLSLADALATSRNTVSVRLVRYVGLKKVIDFARLLGIKSPISHTMSSALGTSVTTVQEIASAYAVFANQGVYNQPFAIGRVEDSNGEVLFKYEAKPVEVIRPEIAYVVTSMLRGVVERGTARGVRVLGRPIAGKTGTTNNFLDNWFIGYSPQLVTGVWVGFDLPRSLGYAETGGRNAAPIFIKFFGEALKGKPVVGFAPPPGVEFVRIDPKTGLLATRSSRKARFEPFVRGTAPTHYSGSEKIRADAIFQADGQNIHSGSVLAR